MCAVLDRKAVRRRRRWRTHRPYDEKLPACIVRAILLVQQPAARLDGTSLASARTFWHGMTGAYHQLRVHVSHRAAAGLSGVSRATVHRQAVLV
jgi:hypothetical protein